MPTHTTTLFGKKLFHLPKKGGLFSRKKTNLQGQNSHPLPFPEPAFEP
jgi:hypothetical protein